MITTKLNKFLFESSEHFGKKIYSVRAICIYCIINIIMISPDMYEIFSSDGFVQKEINDKFIEWYQPRISWITESLEFLNFSENTIILALFSLYLLSFIMVFFRYKPFAFSLVSWIGHLILINSSYLFSYGADYFISFLLFVNVMLNVSTILNVKYDSMLYSFTIRFVQIHLCLVYFFAGFGKTLGTDWFDGNAIWFVINRFTPEFIGIANVLAEYPLIYKVLSFAVLIELLYPFLIFVLKIRNWMLSVILLLHVCIALLMKFYMFGAIMIVLNLIAFGHYYSSSKLLKRIESILPGKGRLVLDKE